MKRRSLAILCTLALLAALLTACGGASGSSGGTSTDSGGTASSSPAEDSPADRGGSYWAPEVFDESEDMGYGGEDYAASGGIPSNSRLDNAKIIYTANLEMETTAYSDCASNLETLVEQMGGYMEYASASSPGSGYRSGNYTVRIPSAQFQSFLHSVGNIGHITYQDKSGENISEQYYDTESRLVTQRTKLERLQALLARAESMEDIITIENAIAETELAVEQLSGELRRYDALVDFATVSIHLYEVARLSTTEQTPPTFSDRLGTAFRESWQGFCDFLEAFAIFLAHAWVGILLLGILAAFIVIVVRRNPKIITFSKNFKDASNPEKPEDGPKE